MSDQEAFDQKLADAGVVPGGEPAPPEPEPVETGGFDDGAVEPPETLYAGKYRSPQELEAAYKEAERRMHEATQRASEYEQQIQQYAQPQQGAPGFEPSVYADDELQRIVARAYQGPQYAKQAYEWALANEAGLGFDAGQVINDLGNAWLQQDFRGAMRFFQEQQAEQFESSLQDERSTVQMHMIEEMANGAEAKAMRELPDYDKWKPLVGQWLQDNPQLVSGYTGTRSVESMVNILRLAYNNVVQEERLRQWAAQQQAAQPDAPAAGTKTQTRSSAAKPQQDDEALAAWKEKLMEARPG